MSGQLVRYDAMCSAIAAMESVVDHCWQFPELPGVYVFDRMGQTLYVGESQNLQRRLMTHERGYLRRSAGVRCRILPCANHKEVERWLIATLRPSLNGVSESTRIRRLNEPAKTSEQIDRDLSDMWQSLFGAAA